MKTKNTGGNVSPRKPNEASWLIWVASTGCLAAASMAAGGCELIASVDPDLLNEGGGGGGTPASSSTGTTVSSASSTTSTGDPTSTSSGGGDGGQGGTGGAGGAGGTGGTGGTGGGECVDPGTDCEEPAECQVAICEDGACGTSNANEGDPCDGGVCNADGACVECIDVAQCDDPPECQVAVCTEAGVCTTEDAENGIDCEGGTTCLDGACQVPAACENGVLDAGETDIDCGGGDVTDCPLCEVDESCLGAGDCETGFCDTDGDDTCQPCGGNDDCAAAEYCDAVTDVCVADKSNGAACDDDDECTSAMCVDGFCCGDICDGACEACTANGCEPVAVGTDDADDCSNTAECLTGVCAADGTCAARDTDTVCGLGERCVGGQEFEQGTCDGAGACEEDPTPTGCGLFECGPDACLDTCADSDDCTDGNFCEGTTCTALKANGTACGVNGGDPDDECDSGNCVDGVCCNTACGDSCDSCTTGTCTAVADLTPGDPACPGDVLCQGGVSTCLANCVDDTDCAANRFCDDSAITGNSGDCLADRAAGLACDDNTDCISNSCGVATANECD